MHFTFNILGFFAHEPSNTLLRTQGSSQGSSDPPWGLQRP